MSRRTMNTSFGATARVEHRARRGADIELGVERLVRVANYRERQIVNLAA